MSQFVCLECEDREVFLNLDLVTEASVSPETVRVHFAGGEITTFDGSAAHELVQALRHEERRHARTS